MKTNNSNKVSLNDRLAFADVLLTEFVTSTRL